jgi:hypothetical protein
MVQKKINTSIFVAPDPDQARKKNNAAPCGSGSAPYIGNHLK